MSSEDSVDVPQEHPLAGKNPQGHAEHLDAYAEVLDEVDAEDIDAAMLVLVGEVGNDTLPTVSEDVDPRWASIWMLGVHIHHVASAAQASGGSASMADVCRDAIQAISEHSGQQEVYGDE